MAKKKPHQPTAGSIHAIHVKRVGYFACVVTRVPQVPTQEPTVFVWIDGTPKQTPEACVDIGDPTTWDGVWLGFCTTRPFTTRRWERVGKVHNFDPQDWPVPPGLQTWGENSPTNCELFTDDGSMRLVANLAEPWPATEVGYIMQASQAEKALTHFIANRKPGFWDMDIGFREVIEQDISSWIKARVSTEKLMAFHPVSFVKPRQVEEGDLYNVPLPGRGFGLVLAVRVEPRVRGCQSVIYWGLPKYSDWPTEPGSNQCFQPEEVIGAWNSDTIGVRAGDWSFAGRLVGFSRELFVVPFSSCDGVFFAHGMEYPIAAATERWGGIAFRIHSSESRSPIGLQWNSSVRTVSRRTLESESTSRTSSGTEKISGSTGRRRIAFRANKFSSGARWPNGLSGKPPTNPRSPYHSI